MTFAATGDTEGFEAFKQSGHAKNTQVAYDNVWITWCEYLTTLRTRSGESGMEQYVTNVVDLQDRRYVWRGFVYYLRDKRVTATASH